MNLLGIAIGLGSIVLGVNSLAKGAKHLSEGLRSDPRPTGGRVPTVVVPRAATRQMPRSMASTPATKTRAGVMGLSKYQVNTLGDRLSVIIDRVEQGTTDPQVVAWARQTVSKRKPGSSAWNGSQWQIPEKRRDLEAAEIFKGVRSSTRYLSDPVGVDLYSKARHILKTGGADCDELATLGCAASRAIGIPCRLVVIATKQSRDGSADHIYYSVNVNGRWVPMDPSVNMGPGWEAPDSMVQRRWVYEVE